KSSGCAAATSDSSSSTRFSSSIVLQTSLDRLARVSISAFFGRTIGPRSEFVSNVHDLAVLNRFLGGGAGGDRAGAVAQVRRRLTVACEAFLKVAEVPDDRLAVFVGVFDFWDEGQGRDRPRLDLVEDVAELATLLVGEVGLEAA